MSKEIRKILIALSALISTSIVASTSFGDEDRIKVESVNVSDVAQRINQSSGHPVVVLLYGTACPLSKQMFPEFVSMAQEYQSRGVKFLVFSTDKPENVYWIPTFLSKHGANFSPVVIRPWAPGSLDRALSPIGIRVGTTYTRPLVAVLDRNGQVIAQGQGVTNLVGIRAALASITK